MQTLLWPSSVVYGCVAHLRRASYRLGLLRSKRLRGMVISVGNLTVGGTGKTPMVAWLAERFSRAGKKTGILSRGYRPLKGGALAGGSHSGEGWNDEAALLRDRLGESVEIGVGANRFVKGRELERLGIECFILDDGFQHLQLARDVDIVLLDATKPLDGGLVLPAGRMRERVSALRHADIVVITRRSHAPALEVLVRRHTACPIFYSETELLAIETYSSPADNLRRATPQANTYFAFCGIGNPEAFFADVTRWGVSLAGQASFRDHHPYTQRDLWMLEERASATGAQALLCTEKDTYDLMPLHSERIPIRFCRIGLRFSDEEGLWGAILRQIEANRSRVFR